MLVEAREAKGVTIQQAAAATRIRVHQLNALEGERFSELDAPVYVRGHLRTYAAYLGLDAGKLIGIFDATLGRRDRPLALRPVSSLTAAPNMVLTAPAAGAIGLVLLILAFTGYVYRELDSVRATAPTPHAAATAIPSPATPPGGSPAPAAAVPAPSPTVTPARLTITATDTVWIDVRVDGKPQFGDSGKVLEAGATVSFQGVKVRVTSGRAGATLITLNGRDLGPLGSGVVTRDFTAQS